MKKKINWKVRFKNKVWLCSFLSLIVGFVFSMLRLFDVYPEISENDIVGTIERILTFLGLVGIIVDPTTEGVYDSERALSYEEPWSDENPNGETEEHDEDPSEEVIKDMESDQTE